MEQKVLIFGKKYANKNGFHRCKEAITISKVDIKKIVLSKNIHSKGAFK